MNKRPLILITNDDGILALGIRTLIKVMRQIGEVVVVAPDSPMSGMGHAITISNPLRVNLIKKEEGYEEYSCNGTPVDAVKLGEKVVVGRKPDLLVSGINHGSNSSINILYSGTMGAVIEGAISGIPSIGFSLLDYSPGADFSHTEKYIKKITLKVLENGLPEGVCLNVNIPLVNGYDIKGIKICRQAKAAWEEDFDVHTDPHQRKFYWLHGEFKNLDDAVDTDEWALENHYVSVTPVKIDLTDHQSITQLKNWEFNN